MRIAHLIITYTDPLQTERFIRRMMHPQFDFYIHLDLKKDLDTHLNLRNIPNVYFIKNRVDVKWAGWSTVKAVLNSVTEILDTGVNYDFVALFSGQDYPIKTPEFMLDFYNRHAGRELMKYESFENEWQESLARVERYHMPNYGFRGRYIIENLLNFFLPKRKPPIPLRFYGRSMFWSLTPAALQYVLEVINGNKKLERFFNFTWAPDEFFFQTILLNSPFAPNVINTNCHFYLHPDRERHPEIMIRKDFDDILRSDKLYARKFNMKVYPTILDMIDTMLDAR